MKTFIDDLNAEPIKKSYGFKSEGRKRNADPSRKGHYLMPGLYEAKGCMDELKSKKITYSFSSTDRNNVSAVVSGIKDKVRSNLGILLDELSLENSTKSCVKMHSIL